MSKEVTYFDDEDLTLQVTVKSPKEMSSWISVEKAIDVLQKQYHDLRGEYRIR